MSIRRHTAYNFLGSIIPIAVALVTVPLYLNLIGAERYGVLALAWVLLGYFSLFDLGLSKATSQRIASKGDLTDDRARTFWSALAVNAATGIVGGLVLYFIADVLLTHFFKISAELRGEAIASVPYLAATVPVATIGGVVTGALIGRERFLEVNVISSASTVLSQFLPLVIGWTVGVRISWLIAAALAARIVALVFLAAACRRHVIGGARPRVERPEALALLSFGGWVTVSSFVGPLMTVLDRFVIGAVLGAVAVALYTIPWQLAQRLLILPISLQTSLFPRQAAASAEEQVRLTQEGLRAVGSVTTPIVVVGMFLMEPFLKFWLGAHFQPVSAVVGRIALLGFWGNGMAFVPFAQVEARGHARTAALVHLVELPFYLGGLFLLMKQFGLAGAAAAFTIRCLVDAAVFNRIALKRNALWAGPVGLASLLFVCLAAAEITAPFSWGWSFGLLFGACAACLLGYAQAPAALRNSVAPIVSRLPFATIR